MKLNHQIIVLLLLAVLTHSNSTTLVECGPCTSNPSITCFKLSGLVNHEILLNPTENCNGYPKSYKFDCVPQCNPGCLMTEVGPNRQSFTECTSTPRSQGSVTTLDHLYQRVPNNRGNLTYNDWCRCDPNNFLATAIHRPLSINNTINSAASGSTTNTVLNTNTVVNGTGTTGTASTASTTSTTSSLFSQPIFPTLSCGSCSSSSLTGQHCLKAQGGSG